MSKSHDPIPPFDLPSEIKSNLTPRPAALLRFYYDPTSSAFGNATEAAARAGYQGTRASLAVQGHRVLLGATAQAEVAVAMERAGANKRAGECRHGRRLLHLRYAPWDW